jgi:hypothetical protein
MTGSVGQRALWRHAAWHALPIIALVLALYLYWFAIADRYRLFLYYHDMGPRVPDTSPFSAPTASRYWMAGLLAGGVVMVLCPGACWLLGRIRPHYAPPDWWRVWAAAAPALLVGIPAITMTLNAPTLPLLHAARTTAAALVGVALGLVPGRLAAERPAYLALLALDGWALAPSLWIVAQLDRIPPLLARGQVWALVATALAIMATLGGLLLLTLLRVWRRLPIPKAGEVFLAGLCAAYPLISLVHHLLGTDGYFYITTADNFFTTRWTLQIGAWLVGALLALGFTRLRQGLASRRAQPPR